MRCCATECRHPVINDRNMVLWRDLGVASWPTNSWWSRPKGRSSPPLQVLRCYTSQPYFSLTIDTLDHIH